MWSKLRRVIGRNGSGIPAAASKVVNGQAQGANSDISAAAMAKQAQNGFTSTESVLKVPPFKPSILDPSIKARLKHEYQVSR